MGLADDTTRQVTLLSALLLVLELSSQYASTKIPNTLWYSLDWLKNKYEQCVNSNDTTKLLNNTLLLGYRIGAEQRLIDAGELNPLDSRYTLEHVLAQIPPSFRKPVKNQLNVLDLAARLFSAPFTVPGKNKYNNHNLYKPPR